MPTFCDLSRTFTAQNATQKYDIEHKIASHPTLNLYEINSCMNQPWLVFENVVTVQIKEKYQRYVQAIK